MKDVEQVVAEVVKHLTGRHDQRDHTRKGITAAYGLYKRLIKNQRLNRGSINILKEEIGNALKVKGLDADVVKRLKEARKAVERISRYADRTAPFAVEDSVLDDIRSIEAAINRYGRSALSKKHLPGAHDQKKHGTARGSGHIPTDLPKMVNDAIEDIGFRGPGGDENPILHRNALVESLTDYLEMWDVQDAFAKVEQAVDNASAGLEYSRVEEDDNIYVKDESKFADALGQELSTILGVNFKSLGENKMSDEKKKGPTVKHMADGRMIIDYSHMDSAKEASMRPEAAPSKPEAAGGQMHSVGDEYHTREATAEELKSVTASVLAKQGFEVPLTEDKSEPASVEDLVAAYKAKAMPKTVQTSGAEKVSEEDHDDEPEEVEDEGSHDLEEQTEVSDDSPDEVQDKTSKATKKNDKQPPAEAKKVGKAMPPEMVEQMEKMKNKKKKNGDEEPEESEEEPKEEEYKSALKMKSLQKGDKVFVPSVKKSGVIVRVLDRVEKAQVRFSEDDVRPFAFKDVMPTGQVK